MLGPRVYFYYYGIFYIRAGDGYEVVEAPAGARIDTLPEGYEEVTGTDDVYYKYDDTTFRRVEEEGKEMYEVVEQ